MENKVNENKLDETKVNKETQNVEIPKEVIETLKNVKNTEKNTKIRGKKAKIEVEAKEITLSLIMLMKANDIKFEQYELQYLEETIKCLVEKYNFQFKYKCEFSFISTLALILYRNYQSNNSFKQRITKIFVFSKGLFKKYIGKIF